MKKVSILFVALMGMVAASCSNDESLDSSVNPSNEQSQLAPVTVSVSGFAVSQSDFSDTDNPQGTTTRAQAVGSYNGIKSLTLAFYASNGAEVYKHTQNRDALEQGDTFGEFSTSLPLGSYTMVVLGYKLFDGDEFALSSANLAGFTGDVRETFAATQPVNITSANAVELSATLDRIVTKLQVVSTDGKTANVSKVRMTFAAGSRSFDPTTGLAPSNTGSVSTVGVSAGVGETSSSVGYVFLATDEQTMNVTIETLDADGNTIYSTVVANVPFKRNRATRLTGSMYDVSASATAGGFQVNTTWLDEEDPINF